VEGVVDYAILMLDPQGYVTSWNAGAERIKGYTAHEILGQHFSVFHTPEDAANGKPERVLDQAIRTGRFEEEGWRVRKDGTRFWASVVVRALHDDDGKLRGFAKITRDLSERLEVEEERRRRLAAEEAAELRAEFLSVAAHELKTPVTSLRGTAELTLRRYSRGDVAPERVKQALEVIQLQSGKLTRLVEQLLDISRVEAGHLAVERQEADVGALAASVVAMFRTRSDGARIQFERPGTRVPAEIDALRVEQVLINLLDNALKYSPAGSPVRLEVSDSKDGNGAIDGVQIAVSDQGPGIPPEDRPHLFDRFFRSRATNFTSGMGLGLSISREIVELHGGTIRAEFPAEGGTRFVVSLPARANEGGAGLKVVAYRSV
jgi:PAS domain S-box-containing protein